MAGVHVAPGFSNPWPDMARRLRGWCSPEGMPIAQLRKMWRRRLFGALGGAVGFAAIATITWWYVVASASVSTDDAYVDAPVTAITPLINGPVLDVRVSDTQSVTRGAVLVVIDPTDEKIAVAQAEADYALAVRRVQQNFADAAAAEAQVTMRRADLTHAQSSYQRRAALAQTGAISADELTASRNARDVAEAELDAAQENLTAQLAPIRGRSIETNPEVLAAKAALDAAKLALSRTVIRAPVDGIVAQSDVRVGQRVQIGTALMSIVPISHVYVDANFKENQLGKVHIGQAAVLTSDFYGSGVVFHGRVVGVGGGTGSAFAVIPAQNATGNWIKIVQRLPVRIALDPKELVHHPLRVGLSMATTISVAKTPAPANADQAGMANKATVTPATVRSVANGINPD